MDEPQWSIIEEFPNYLVNDQGEIFNRSLDRYMRTYPNTYGHMRITLTDEETGERSDRGVAKLVAEAFVEPPNELCNRVMILDGRLSNVMAVNLVWRPRYFVMRYARQLKRAEHPVHYKNLRIKNCSTGKRYKNVIECGMTEGLLFDDVWRSTYTGANIFPYGDSFEVL